MHEKKSRSCCGADVTRREFMVTTLAAGFALAAQPVSAQTITTGTEGLSARDVQIPVSDGQLPGYLAKPASGTSLPVVLVVQEIFGVHEHIKDICRRLAKIGYVAIAPELYARQGDVSKLSKVQDIVSQVVSKVPDAQVMSDLDATVAFAKHSEKANTDRLGLTGFCWGGRIVWLYAAHSSHLKAGVAWYGRLVGPTDTLHPKNPMDLVAELKAPVLGLYGGADAGIPLDTIERMRQALKAAGNPSEIIVYPDAPHGFNADYRDSYRKEAATDGWRRMVEWFKQHGVG
jgi:carboxymethylenebutenolidase